jgi:hypothetical protein
MTDDASRGAYLFDAYFQESVDFGADWESVVLRFMKSEPVELVLATHDALARVVAGSSERELIDALFGPVPLSSYQPRPQNLTARAWVEEIVYILAGGAPRNSDSIAGARREAVSIARRVLAGEVDVLVGARDLRGLRFRVGVPVDDPDFTCFVVIESETDALPLSDERSQWSAEALLRLDPDVARAIDWATEVGWQAFKNVVERFEPAG